MDVVRQQLGSLFEQTIQLTAPSQRLSLFVLQPEGAWFAWMKTTQLKKLGPDPSFADGFYQQLADSYGVGLRKGVPDGLTIEALVADQDSLEEIVRTFVRDVRAALSTAGASA